jgi:hypothetical protein
MTVPGSSDEPEHFTDNLRGSFGYFTSKGKYQLAFVSTDFSLSRLRLLKTARQILPRKDLQLDELMQRDINDTRVRKEIIPYLRQGGGLNVKFFPPILVAVLPKQSHDDDSPADRYPQPNLTDEGEFPREKDESDNLYYEKRTYKSYFSVKIPLSDKHTDTLNNDLGYATKFEWNRDNVNLFVMDGQHRLMALKGAYGLLEKEQLVRGYEDAELSEADKKAIGIHKVPVTLIFPPLLYEGREGLDDNDRVIRVFRQIFVDVNRSAQDVSKSRNILLNERSLLSEFTRIIVSNFLNERQLPSGEVGASRIPLYAFEWDSPEGRENKINHSRAISSVGILHECIRRVTAPNDEQFRENFSLTEGDTDIDPVEADADGVSVGRLSPNHFSEWQKETIVSRFKHRWRDSFESFLKDFYPSQQLLKKLESKRIELEDRLSKSTDDTEAKAKRDYLLGTSSDQELIRLISTKNSEESVAGYHPSTSASAIKSIKSFFDELQASKTDDHFSRLFFSNLGQTEIAEFIYIDLLNNVSNDHPALDTFVSSFASSFNSAFRDNEANKKLFDPEKEWNSLAISSLGTNSWKRNHMRGLLYVSLAFMPDDSRFADFYQEDDKSIWKDVVLNFYKQAIVEDDSYIRDSLKSRLPFQVRNYPDIRVIAEDKTRREKIDKRVQTESNRIITELHDFICERTSPAESFTDILD